MVAEGRGLLVVGNCALVGFEFRTTGRKEGGQCTVMSSVKPPYARGPEHLITIRQLPATQRERKFGRRGASLPLCGQIVDHLLAEEKAEW